MEMLKKEMPDQGRKLGKSSETLLPHLDAFLQYLLAVEKQPKRFEGQADPRGKPWIPTKYFLLNP